MKINGTYKILYIKKSGTYFPIGCLTSNSFSESSTMIDTTVRSNINGWKSSRPVSQSYNISFSGVLETEDIGIIDYRYLQTLKRGRTLIEWKIETSLGDDVDYGNGYINSLSDTGDIDTLISFNGSIEGIGEPSVEIGTIVYNFDVFESDIYE